jgi:hypothetical protein
VNAKGLGILHPRGTAPAPSDRGLGGSDPPRVLLELPAPRKSAILAAWLAEIVAGYPENASRFLLEEQDRFRNPVGDAVKKGLPQLLDQLLADADSGQMSPVLDDIIRIRAVQDFTAGQAVGFLFLLKKVVRQHLKQQPLSEAESFDMDLLHERIDAMALLAFDLFQKCRDRICEIKVNEMKRRCYVLERTHPFLCGTAPAGDSEEPGPEVPLEGGKE